MFTVIDLFSGFGGWTRGGVDAGLQVLWAANHWSAAVEWHTKNNPDKNHSETKKAYAVKRKPLIFMVPEAGIEPARPYERGILSPMRLPVSPFGR